MQLIAETFTELREGLQARPTVPERHGFGGGGIERDGSGIWIPGDPWTGLGTDKLSTPMSQHATVFKAVSVIARNLSSVKLEFFLGDSDKALPPTDPIPQLFAAPEKRAGLRQRQFIAKHAQDMELSGDWFVIFDEIARPAGARSKEIPGTMTRVARSRMKPDVDRQTREFKGWILDGRTRIAPEMVMHSMYPGPYDDYLGLAPLAAAWMEADSDYQAQLWNRYVFENGSPGVVFTRDKDAAFNAGKDRIFEEEFSSRNQGPKRISKTAVLPPGMDLKELAANQREMSFIELRQFSREQILSVFDVPPPVAGIFADATLANITQALRFFWYHKLFPMMDDLESVIQTDLLDRFNTGVRCAFKREAVQGLIDDYSEKLEAATKLWGMGVPFEAINDRLDLGFDTNLIDGADIGYLPFSVSPVERVLEPPTPPAPVPPKQVPPPDGKQRLLVAHSDKRERQWKAHAAQLDKFERRYLGDYRKFLKWLGDETVARLTQSAGASAMARVIHTTDESLPRRDEYHEKVVDETDRTVKASVESGWRGAAAQLDADLAFSLLDPHVVEILATRHARIVGASDQAVARLREEIANGIEKGETVDELADRVRGKISEEYAGQARVVARTETAGAFENARQGVFDVAGIEQEEWLSARDENVRESHQIDGEIVKRGQPFSNGLLWPHDESGPPEEIIQCRCTALPVIS